MRDLYFNLGRTVKDFLGFACVALVARFLVIQRFSPECFWHHYTCYSIYILV